MLRARPRPVLIPLLAALALAVAAAGPARAKSITLTPVKREAGMLTFDLSRIGGAPVVSAHLFTRHGTRRLDTGKVRRAARHGRLHVREERPRRPHGRATRAKPKIVIVTADPAPSPGTTGSRTPRAWILTGWNIEQIRDADAPLAEYFFDTPSALATGNEDGRQNQVLPGFAARPALKYESFARFEQDVQAGRIDSSVRTVIYDPENWDQTPEDERRDPRTYFRRFWELAHPLGYHVIHSPSRDLMQVPGAVCGRASGETLSDAFLRCGIAAAAARHADTYKVQAQVHERDPATYRWFVEATGAQARAANPDVRFMANLSTSPYDYVATAEMLLRAHDAVGDLVAGHYLSMNSPDLPIGLEFLRLVRATDG